MAIGAGIAVICVLLGFCLGVYQKNNDDNN
jgi:hypothetical protein